MEEEAVVVVAAEGRLRVPENVEAGIAEIEEELEESRAEEVRVAAEVVSAERLLRSGAASADMDEENVPSVSLETERLRSSLAGGAGDGDRISTGMAADVWRGQQASSAPRTASNRQGRAAVDYQLTTLETRLTMSQSKSGPHTAPRPVSR